jgi:site-specific recombinase XerD
MPLDRVYIQRRHVKGSTEGRSIVLHTEAKEAIKTLVIAEKMQNDWFLFKSRKGFNKPISTCQAWRILKDLYTRAGITGHVATHTMRKTFADRIHKASGRDIFQTQRALGHKSLDNTAAYLSFDQAELDALVKGAK